MILTICLVVTYLTEITSNTATATLLMPILSVAALASGYDPSVFMIPAAICASCAFMLPVATAPNAIVYGSWGNHYSRNGERRGGTEFHRFLCCWYYLFCFFIDVKIRQCFGLLIKRSRIPVG